MNNYDNVKNLREGNSFMATINYFSENKTEPPSFRVDYMICSKRCEHCGTIGILCPNTSLLFLRSNMPIIIVAMVPDNILKNYIF